MIDKKMNVGIISGSKALEEIINRCGRGGAANIVGVVDIDNNALTIKLAKELNIPVFTNYNELMHEEGADIVIDLTNDDRIRENLFKNKIPGVEIVSGNVAKMMLRLIEKHAQVEQELNKVKEELEIEKWGLQKTNNGVKLLYKELEEKNKRLQELDQLKSTFVSTVSHELRTPLTIVKEGISLVLDRIAGELNEKQEKILGVAKESIDRLSRIINNLLDVSKIESGKMELRRELVDITNLIEEVVLSLGLKAKEKNLELKTDMPEDGIEVYVDADKMVQVFTNLINNAIKFTNEGYIEVAARQKTEEIECAVIDTGIGISKEDMPRVFDKFRQFGRSAGAGEKGTGLGLSIVKEIIKMHKGNIWVESEPGKKTKFIITLPKYSSETLFKEYIDSGIKEATKKGSKMSLLLISIAEFYELQKIASPKEIKSLLKEIADVLNNGLRQKGDIVIKDTGEVVALLVDCDKNNALKVRGRLERLLNDYLASHKMAKNIKLRFGCATYPDEAKSEAELIKKARGE